MKHTSYTLLPILAFLCLVACNSAELEAPGIQTIGGPHDGLYGIFVSEDMAARQDQSIFIVGPEGGVLNLVAYYPFAFKTEDGRIKDTLNDEYEVADPDSLITALTRTKRSGLETAYSFTIGKNTTGKDRAAMIQLLDISGFPKGKGAIARFLITQKAE